MLIIRLQRTGRKNNPDFRVVLAEKHRAAAKKAVEVFGQYNPKTKELHLSDKEGLTAWVSKNVELSPTVRNLLISKQIITGTKVKAWRPKVKEQAAGAPTEAQPAEAKTEQKAEDKPEVKEEKKSEEPKAQEGEEGK